MLLLFRALFPSKYEANQNTGQKLSSHSEEYIQGICYGVCLDNDIRDNFVCLI